MTEQERVEAWHTLDVHEVSRMLGASLDHGLSDEEAAARLLQYGENTIREEERAHPITLFLNQFRDFMIYVLIAAAAISGFLLGEILDALVILFIVIANAILGFIQEYRAERALESLRQLSAPTALVIRGGREKEIPSREIVPGDLLLIETGDFVPADARVAHPHNLRADQSSLTGESEADNKNAATFDDPELPLGDRANMVYSGTHIVHGRGDGVVVATGKVTELGKIAELLGEAEPEKTPLQNELGKTGVRIALLCIAIAGIIFIFGLLRNLEWSEMLLFSVSLAVAAIPEGLPAIVTIALALGMRRMADRNAVLRRLTAVETLGSADVICTDKTGTLTRNEMEVEELRLPESPPIEGARDEVLGPESRDLAWPLLATASLCNDAKARGDGFLGEGTEVALLRMAVDLSFPLDEALADLPRVEEVPFESERKMMSTINAASEIGNAKFFPFSDASFLVLAKGAPEAVLDRCDRILTRDGVRELSRAEHSYYSGEAEEMAKRALRTLAFACRPLQHIPAPGEIESVEGNLIYLGLVGMMDPPRPEVMPALDACRKASIEVVMVTGDHAATAQAIAERLGILTPGKEIITGEELSRMSDEELASRVQSIAVYARLSPADKVKIVKAWKEIGKVVAMTGDGVNDAPGLKNADIGVAMGIAGTDVSKQAADMVLADDNFATIVNAVEEGRIIFDNLKKFVYFLLSCNMSEVATMFIAMLASSMTPLSAVQVLWMNLVTDGFPAMALGIDTPAPDVMSRPPREASEGILSWRRQLHIIWQGLTLSLGALASFFIARYWLFDVSGGGVELGKVRTIVFTTLVLSQLLHSFNSRSEHLSVTRLSFFDNKALLAALGASLTLQLGVILVPPLMRLFGTEYLNLSAWLLIIAASIVPAILIDRIKVLLNRG
ncbi:MAG: calcium-translocating P-type ATPase, PMCA-type [Candidatus Solincola sediminis]|uniref:P-type Ca(2+) transporter n=1 Tax=Candidatus Solincola sediminis TaxID=1797199 RepID=A0A1F2WJ67_9ACTN|nr:MAG: calcium-translocating P-type ATPase, PMCA-type [Candidatus Solincola sediminis]OFW60345.1 MAG: calcium-translocating P-type ATPase, PMCA-type [Candidatus Solincola sediminis]